MKKYLLFVVAILLTSSTFSQVNSSEAKKYLEEGNKRYTSGNFSTKHLSADRDEQRKGQHPYAIVLTCADSRVPPELIFDEGLGKLFVVRVAGNVVDDVVLGSIEYAAEHLHVPLLVVLGHSACGAVKATVDGVEAGKNIGALVDRIKPAVEKAKGKSRDKSLILQLAIEANVDDQVNAAINDSKILQELIHEGKFKVIGGVYNIESGEVSLFEPVFSSGGHNGTAEKHSEANEHGKSNEHAPEKKEATEVKEHHPHGSMETAHEDVTENGNAIAEKFVGNNVFEISDKYCVQTGAFIIKSNADNEYERLKNQHKKVFISKYEDAATNRIWYRVRIGYFDSMNEALSNAPHVNQGGHGAVNNVAASNTGGHSTAAPAASSASHHGGH